MNKYQYAFSKAKEAFLNPNKPYKYSVNDTDIKCLQCGNDKFTADVHDPLSTINEFVIHQLACSKCSFVMLFNNCPNRLKNDQEKG